MLLVLLALHSVALRVEPAQPVPALVLRNGDETRAVDVRDGRALVPDDLPLPWTVGQTRFEATTYTREDLDAKRPLLLRELGTLRGVLRRPNPRDGERFTFLLQRANEEVQEREVTSSASGAFELRLPAGTYHGALLGQSVATRIRSGLVVQPGRTTDAGTLEGEPTVPVTLRVVDAKRGVPVANAAVAWDPPGEALNAGVARTLYGKRWTTTTDRRGIATFPSVGPLPIPVRWRVTSGGYAPSRTAQVQLAERRAAVVPDTRLRAEAVVVVRVRLPFFDGPFEGATLVVSDLHDDRLRFHPVARAKLKEGDIPFRLHEYGRKRVAIADASGRTILYRDFDVSSESSVIDLAPEKIEVRGLITRNGEAVEGVRVTLADPTDAQVVLAKTRSDDDGDYRIETWQDGELFLYTVDRDGGVARKKVTPSGTDVRVDFELPDFGFAIAVVDDATGNPIRDASVMNKLDFGGGHSLLGDSETGEDGRLRVSGHHSGRARVTVQAKGYRVRELDIELRRDAPETTVRLERGARLSGRVVDVHGAPLPNAVVSGGYASELDAQGDFEATTDAMGRFAFDSEPPPHTRFYVVAPRHALANVTLASGRENTIVMTPPGGGIITLMPDDAPPAKLYLAIPALGGTLVPMGPLADLAEMNGMTTFQLQGTAKDGSLALPAFLAPGTYDLHLVRQGYPKIGSITTPMPRNIVLAPRVNGR